jgi:DNA-binding transcriptional MerR regulator
MFKIGDFSRLSRVSIKTLRYYDRVSLLKPAYVDPNSDYRYYTADQLATLNLILALKDFGLSLNQVSQLLAESVPLEQLHGMLRLKRTELAAQIADEQQRLARIEARLQQIEQDQAVDVTGAVLKSMPDQPVASVRATIDAYPEVSGLFDLLFSGLASQQIASAGPPLTIYLQPEYRDHDIDVEVAVAVGEAVLATTLSCPPIQFKTLAGAEAMACVVHQGSYESVSSAYTALTHWLELNHYEIDGNFREVYLHDFLRSKPPIIEIQVPVKTGG